MKQVFLRPPIPSDKDILYEWINNRELVLFNAPFQIISRSEHDAWFSKLQKNDLAFFMIEHIETRLAIGSCQLHSIHSIHRSAELQIRIGRMDFQNKGVGTEAIIQLLSYGFLNLDLHRIYLHVLETNIRAIHVYKKIGFVREGLLRQAAFIDNKWCDVQIMAKVKGIDE